MVKEMLNALQAVITSRKHLGITIISALAMFSLAIIFPVFAIPGNDLFFQLSILTWDSLLLTVIFSLLFGFSIGIHSYASFLSKQLALGSNAATGIVSFVATLFSAKLCPICLATIFSIIGVGGSVPLFLFSYKTEILLISFVLIFASIFLASKRIVKCRHCTK